jgi:hypothetical protein
MPLRGERFGTAGYGRRFSACLAAAKRALYASGKCL